MTKTQVEEPLPHKILRNDTAARWLGIEVIEASDGHAVITMELREEMLNGFGIGHGGMIFTLADTAFAMSCNEVEGSEETITVASGADINFLKPAVLGRKLTATGNRVSQQGRSGLYDITVTQETSDGTSEVIAEFRGRSRTIPKPKSR
ncbi:hydroxyphenylacetyl-CoA thioesterase PaaI [Glutamicibacter sp. AOP5-A2-18]|uniref:hydroxyphenylacetyl-CoA thioesterase PaaI n=1 Tax=Glutamicibacter sp. AOP5-A2-18 TaxID=3457656 RepID=UPI0040346FAF